MHQFLNQLYLILTFDKSTRPNRFDMLIYHLFYRIWNPIFQNKPELANYFANYMLEWNAINSKLKNK